MDKNINKSKKYSYIVIIIIITVIILSIVPWNDFLNNDIKVGVVEIKAPIMDSKEIIEDLNYFQLKSNIDAIVVRVDSPGGGVAASQEIYYKVKNISKEGNKPIIVSMGGVAASGGYYLALGADTIIANPGTTTGSIGVIMNYPIISELMKKVGLEYETIKSGKLKDSGSPFRKLQIEERKYFQNLINDLHAQFVTAVVEERKLTNEIVSSLAKGQVFTGKQALDNGLIDLLGTFEDAVKLPSKLVGGTTTPIVIYPPKKKKGLLDLLFGDIFQSATVDNLVIYPRPEYKINY